MAAPSDIRRRILFWTLLLQGGLIPLSAGLTWWWDLPLGDRVRLSWASLGWGVLAAGPMLLWLAVDEWLTAGKWGAWGPIEQLRRDVDEKLLPLLKHCTIGDFAVISVLAGVGEEWLFRGVLQEVLLRLLPWWGALLVASLAFGAVHAVSWPYAVLVVAAGLYLGIVYQVSGDLGVVVVAHGLYDFVALVYLCRLRPLGRTDAAIPPWEDDPGV